MKKARIELVFNPGLALYQVVKLVNLATFTVEPGRGSVKMIGSDLDCWEAEVVATDRRFDVTITQAK